MKLRTMIGLLLVSALLAVSLSACGKSSTSGSSSNSNVAPSNIGVSSSNSCVTRSEHFAKTKFIIHAGIAAGAFHRYVYKPLRSGGFKSGASGRKATFVKAAAAAVLMVHEIKQATQDAEADSHLCHLVKGLKSFTGSVSTLIAKLKGGTATAADLNSSESLLGSVQKSAGFSDK